MDIIVNKDRDCQAEAILTSLLGYSVLADLSQYNTIDDTAERWRSKIDRIYSHWAPVHPDERTQLEHMFRSCTDEFGFHKMYLQMKEYQQTVELIKIQEMVLSEASLRQIITGAQITNRALKTAIENAYATIPNANFQLVTDNILLKINADKHFECRKRSYNILKGQYWDPAQTMTASSSKSVHFANSTSISNPFPNNDSRTPHPNRTSNWRNQGGRNTGRHSDNAGRGRGRGRGRHIPRNPSTSTPVPPSVSPQQTNSATDSARTVTFTNN